MALGKYHFNQRNTEEARARVEQVVAASPGSPEPEEAKAFLEEIEDRQGSDPLDAFL